MNELSRTIRGDFRGEQTRTQPTDRRESAQDAKHDTLSGVRHCRCSNQITWAKQYTQRICTQIPTRNDTSGMERTHNQQGAQNFNQEWDPAFGSWVNTV